MKRTTILLAGLLAVSALDAQKSLEILNLSGRYASPTSYDSVYTGNAQESGSFVALTVPVPVTEKTIIYNSLNYFYFHVGNETALRAGVADPVNLHGFILRTGIIRRLSNGQSLQLLISPRYMSDMKGGGIDNFQFGAMALYEKVFHDRLTMAFGAMFNQECFGPYMVPVVSLDWQLSERWAITGMLPVYAKVKYKAGEKLTIGISHFGLVTSFRLNDAAYDGDYIERQSIDLSLFINYRLMKNIYLEGRVGRSMGRSYAQYAGDQKVDFGIPLVKFGDDRELESVDFKDGLIAELRLIYAIPIPEK
jgi:hypothetical protein